MKTETTLETRRLRLRSWQRSDARPFDQFCNTPKVMRWLGGVQPKAQLLQDVAYFIASERRDGVTFWVVERLTDDAFLGFCGLIVIPKGKCPVGGDFGIGWRLRSDVWRQGYALEAASAVLRFGFEQMGRTQILSRTAKGNKASLGLMRRLGMKRCPELDYLCPSEQSVLMAHIISNSATSREQ